MARSRGLRHGYAVEDQRIMETVANKIMALVEVGRRARSCRSGLVKM
jgi:hypothetical protein